MREQIAQLMPTFDISAVERLTDCPYALHEAQVRKAADSIGIATPCSVKA